MAGPPVSGQVLPPALPPGPQQQGQIPTPLLDALIARGLIGLQGKPELESATPLESYPQLPNPDPNSAPPLYGEPPGLGYLYAREPQFRQEALVDTNPEIVRKQILRAMEVLAQNAQLPFSEYGPEKNADGILKLAQAYLLIDPSVDAEGVPVAAKMTAQGGAAIAGAMMRPAPGAPPTAKRGGEASGSVQKGRNVGGHAQPPRVLAGAAAQHLREMHQGLEQMLKGSRASRPLPRPRPSA